MGRLLLSLLAALSLLACSTSPQPAAATTPSPSAMATNGSPGISVHPPGEVILADADVGLTRSAGRDHVSLTQAASEQQNQPLALTEYRQWGWVEESTRSWSGEALRVDESLVLLTRTEGSTLAFQGWAGELDQRAPCPDGLGLDECAVGSGGLVGRAGRYVFRLSGSGVDVAKFAGVQAAKIRAP